MFVKIQKTFVLVLGLVVSSSSVVQAQGAFVDVLSRTTRSGTFDPMGNHSVEVESRQGGFYGPVTSSAPDSIGPGTAIAGTRAIDGIEIKTYSNLTLTDKTMGASAKSGGDGVKLFQRDTGAVGGYAEGFVWQADRFRVSSPLSGTSSLDMRLEIDGTLAVVGNQAGDRAGVSMFGELYIPSTFSGGDLYGLTGVLNNSATGANLTTATTEPTSQFGVADWQGSWTSATAGPGETAWDVDYDQTESGVLTVPNNTDFVIIHYLRVDAQSDGAGNGAVSNFYNTTSFDLALTTPTPGSSLVRISSVHLGDCNQDGVVNFLDIARFITILTAGSFLEQADCNQDGVADFLDIAEFITILGAS